MAAMADIPADLARSPAFYPMALDMAREAIFFLAMDEVTYNASSFLDERIAAHEKTGSWIPVAQVQGVLSNRAAVKPLHFIFHAGHVGSTLLSRLIAETGRVLSLREPLPLRALAEACDMGAPNTDTFLETMLCLWERGFPGNDAVILKATSITERLAPRLLTMRPAAKAVALNVSAEVYLATMFAAANSPVDLNAHGPERLHRLRSMGIEVQPPTTLGELTAISWLAEKMTQGDMQKQFDARVLPIDFDQMLHSIENTMANVLAHFGITHSAADIAAIAASPALSFYSKAPEQAYSPELRASLLGEARGRYPQEIRAALAWLERLAAMDDRVAVLL